MIAIRSTPHLLVLGLVAFTTLAVASACSDDSNPAAPDYSGSCDVLASQCHGGASPLAVECHDLGHAGDDAKCGPRRDECLAACPKEGTEPEPTKDASADSAPADDAAAEAGPSAACVDYCTCMATSCSTMNNYPFTDESVCFSACAAFSDEERACFQFHCDDAAGSGSHDHACDHATGKLGLAECP